MFTLIIYNNQGLGKFKEQLKKGSAERNLGSIPWTAPEILGEEPDVQYEMSDVYSFGIVSEDNLISHNN